MRVAVVSGVALLCAAVPATAQQFETTASATIARGGYSEAERVLRDEVRRHSSRPEFMLNLAAVYARTGRDSEARSLYQRVLSMKDVPMDLAGPNEAWAGSHAIARAGLRRLGAGPETAAVQ